MRRFSLLVLSLFAFTAAAETAPKLEEKYDKFSGQTTLRTNPAIKSNVDGITVEAVAWVSYSKEQPAEKVYLDFTITGMKTRWSNRRRPEVAILWDEKDRAALIGCAFGVREDGAQTLRIAFAKAAIAKTTAARTTEFKADDAEFALTLEAVAAIKELAKRGKVK